jgi:hypothetical protein
MPNSQNPENLWSSKNPERDMELRGYLKLQGYVELQRYDGLQINVTRHMV